MSSKVHPDIFPDGIEETMSYELLFDDGFQAICRASYSHSYHQCITLGDHGSVEIKGGPRNDKGWGSAYGQSGAGKPNPKTLFHGRKEIKLEQTLQQGVLLDEFAQSIKRGEKNFKASGEMGLRDIQIIERIYKSAIAGGSLISTS
jgi:predicted dehydrogenase